MELELLKPDIGRIEVLFGYNEHTRHLLHEEWEGICNGIIPYPVMENQALLALLKEYELDSFMNDLLFIAHKCQKQKKQDLQTEDFLRSLSGMGEQEIEALKFLFEYDLSEIKIDIKHKTKNVSVSIKNLILIYKLREALHNMYIEDCSYFNAGLLNPSEITDWGGYYNLIVNLEDGFVKRKGRKRKHHSTGRYIKYLKNYLQEFTHLKSEQGILISRSQASFIFKFLDAIGFIDNEFAWKEDNIRLILSKHIESLPTFSMAKEGISEWNRKQTSFINKVKNLNKKK